MHFKRLCPARWAVGACLLVHTWTFAADVTVRVTDEAGRPLADAVVFLDSPSAKAATKPRAGVEVEQVARQFLPKTTVVTVGSPVTFPNHDTVRHHVYSFSTAKVFDLKLYAGTPTTPVIFDKPGVVVLGCNIHDQMLAWILVVETPFFGKTDANGAIALANVPPGSYHLKAWHSRLPPGAPMPDQTLAVAASAAAATVSMKGLDP